ncbi:hypothetical protein D3C81_1296770 [compost metagenome]
MLTQAIQGTANALNQGFELLGHQLDRHEQLSQVEHRLDAVLVAAAVLLQYLEGSVQLFLNGTKALLCNDRVGTAFGLFLFLVTFLLFVFVVSFGLGRCFRVDWRRHFGWRRNAVVRVDVAAENVGQAATFGGDAIVLGEDVIDSTREVGDSTHDFTDTFFDPLGDFDFAFAGQKLDGTHFTHVHAHRVSRATNIGFHSRQRCGGFFSCGFVGVGFGQQKGIRIRSTLEYVDPHVVDHADDVFHLLRI